jgi:hypothetical protein
VPTIVVAISFNIQKRILFSLTDNFRIAKQTNTKYHHHHFNHHRQMFPRSDRAALGVAALRLVQRSIRETSSDNDNDIIVAVGDDDDNITTIAISIDDDGGQRR